MGLLMNHKMSTSIRKISKEKIKQYLKYKENRRTIDLLYASSPYTKKYNKYNFYRRRTATDKKIIKMLIGQKNSRLHLFKTSQI